MTAISRMALTSGGDDDGLDLHLGDFGVCDDHTDRAVTEHRVLFLFQAAVVRESRRQKYQADYVGIVGAVLSLCDTHGFRRYPPEADTRF